MNDKELFELCKRYGREAKLWKRRFVALLPEVYRRGLYRRKGYGSIFEFAAKLGGVSKNVVEDVLNLDVKLEDKPELKKLIPKVGVNKVRIVATIAKKDDENEWVKKVKKMSKLALETHVRDMRMSDPGIGIPTAPQELIFDNNYENFTVKLDPKIIQKLKYLKANMKKGTTWNEVFIQLLEGKKIKKSRARNLKTKSKEVCEVPGCNKPATIIHHPDRYALTKTHEKLVSFCKAHHELAHRGYIDEDSDFRALRNPLINPIKTVIDQKMLVFLRGP